MIIECVQNRHFDIKFEPVQIFLIIASLIVENQGDAIATKTKRRKMKKMERKKGRCVNILTKLISFWNMQHKVRISADPSLLFSRIFSIFKYHTLFMPSYCLLQFLGSLASACLQRFQWRIVCLSPSHLVWRVLLIKDNHVYFVIGIAE